MPEQRIASVTLRDLADDIAYWNTQIPPATSSPSSEDVERVRKAFNGLVEVLQAYNEARFLVGPDS